MSILNAFPLDKDSWIKVMSYLDEKDQYRSSRVCRFSYNCITNSDLKVKTIFDVIRASRSKEDVGIRLSWGSNKSFKIHDITDPWIFLATNDCLHTFHRFSKQTYTTIFENTSISSVHTLSDAHFFVFCTNGLVKFYALNSENSDCIDCKHELQIFTEEEQIDIRNIGGQVIQKSSFSREAGIFHVLTYFGQVTIDMKEKKILNLQNTLNQLHVHPPVSTYRTYLEQSNSTHHFGIGWIDRSNHCSLFSLSIATEEVAWKSRLPLYKGLSQIVSSSHQLVGATDQWLIIQQVQCRETQAGYRNSYSLFHVLTAKEGKELWRFEINVYRAPARCSLTGDFLCVLSEDKVFIWNIAVRAHITTLCLEDLLYQDPLCDLRINNVVITKTNIKLVLTGSLRSSSFLQEYSYSIDGEQDVEACQVIKTEPQGRAIPIHEEERVRADQLEVIQEVADVAQRVLQPAVVAEPGRRSRGMFRLCC